MSTKSITDTPYAIFWTQNFVTHRMRRAVFSLCSHFKAMISLLFDRNVKSEHKPLRRRLTSLGIPLFLQSPQPFRSAFEYVNVVVPRSIFSFFQSSYNPKIQRHHFLRIPFFPFSLHLFKRFWSLSHISLFQYQFRQATKQQQTYSLQSEDSHGAVVSLS